MQDSQKLKVAILRLLHGASGSISSGDMARQLHDAGFDISARSVRLYMEELANDGLVDNARRGRHGGRRITDRGTREINDASAHERVGLLAVRMDTLAWNTTFDPLLKDGNIVLNLTVFNDRHLARVVAEMLPVFDAGLSMGKYVGLFREGDTVGRIQIPRGKIGIGTVCSVTLNGILLKAGIPTISRFGGVLQFSQRQPARFTDVIHYEGTSLDPLEIFIKSGLTRVRDAARTGSGKIGASFREVPSCALKEVEHIIRRLDEVGLGGVLSLGKPNQPLLDFAVPEGHTGLVVAGGLNPAAAIQEAGIPAEHMAMAHFYEFEKLIHYKELPRQCW